VEPQIVPTARVFGTLVYDEIDTSLILLGGCEPTQCPAVDPFAFSLQAKPTGGSPLPGGLPPPPPPPWPWDLVSLTQTIIESGLSEPTPPTPARYGMGAVWDPMDGSAGYILFLGGRMSNGVTLSETDILAGYLWTKLANFG
jgi:hypothetical protein